VLILIWIHMPLEKGNAQTFFGFAPTKSHLKDDAIA
jgi:hypothetical protein